ncbi:hypothetical protein LCGC14_2235290 [marine sediment metagenome]|uniref:Serine aminopeptidase S33 domain-containing protein n=1 Tax=marine sediment metagenome TaxID=412755 RepID=A0A0F9DUL0_9ZZZZ
MSRHICVILHGSKVDPKLTCWAEQLEWIIQPQAPAIEFVTRKYGYVTEWRTAFGGYRDRWLEEQLIYFNHIKSYCGPTTKVSVIAHSFGPWIIGKLLPKFEFHNLIFMMGAMDENYDWNEVDQQFSRILNYWSPNDTKVKKSPYGRIGYVGHQFPHERVKSTKVRWTHDEFQEDSNLYLLSKEWTSPEGLLNR